MNIKYSKLLGLSFLIFIMLIVSWTCNLFEDEESTVQSFYGTATFTYDRPWTINPNCSITYVALNITLKAPWRDIEPPIHMDKIDDGLFQYSLTESFTYQENREIKHEAMVADPCLSDGQPFSNQTGHGIIITISGFRIESEVVPTGYGVGTKLMWWMIPE